MSRIATVTDGTRQLLTLTAVVALLGSLLVFNLAPLNAEGSGFEAEDPQTSGQLPPQTSRHQAHAALAVIPAAPAPSRLSVPGPIIARGDSPLVQGIGQGEGFTPSGPRQPWTREGTNRSYLEAMTRYLHAFQHAPCSDIRAKHDSATQSCS